MSTLKLTSPASEDAMLLLSKLEYFDSIEKHIRHLRKEKRLVRAEIKRRLAAFRPDASLSAFQFHSLVKAERPHRVH